MGGGTKITYLGVPQYRGVLISP